MLSYRSQCRENLNGDETVLWAYIDILVREAATTSWIAAADTLTNEQCELVLDVKKLVGGESPPPLTMFLKWAREWPDLSDSWFPEA